MDKLTSNMLDQEYGANNKTLVYVIAVPILGGAILAIISLIMCFWGDSSFWIKVFGSSLLVYIVSALFYQKHKNDYKETRCAEIQSSKGFTFHTNNTTSRKSKFQQRLDEYMEQAKKDKDEPTSQS